MRCRLSPLKGSSFCERHMPSAPPDADEIPLVFRDAEEAKAVLQFVATKAFNRKTDSRIANTVILAVNAFKGLLDVADVQRQHAEMKAWIEEWRASNGSHQAAG